MEKGSFSAEINEKYLLDAINGDEKAIKIIYENNTPLIRKIVLKYVYKTPESFDDLFQEASCAFIKYLKSYDQTKGYKFSTYIYNCISGQLSAYLRKQRYYLHVPNQIQYEHYYYNKYLNMGYNDEQIMEKMGITEERLDILKDIERTTVVSTDSIISESGDTELGDVCVSKENVEEESVNNIAYNELIEEIRKILNEKEFSIFCMLNGINCDQMNLTQVGRVYNVTHQCINSTRNRIIKKLQKRLDILL